VLAACLAVAGPCRADLWETPGWALLGTATARTGYDSNLTFNRDGEGDTFGTAEADLLLERINSSMMTSFAVTAAETDFLSQRAPSQLDASGILSLRYPNADDELPRFSAVAEWIRTTAADPELNRRLTLEKTSADVGGRVLTSGQFGLNADLDSTLYDYSADGLGQSHETDLKAGLAFDPSPLTEVSANLAGGFGGSSGAGDGTPSVQDRSETATLQVRGQILPKLTSTLYAGVTHVEYSGGYSNTSTLPTSGGELVWEMSPASSLRGGVSLSTGFAPDGETQRKSQGTLDYRHALSQAWSADLLASASRYSDRSSGFVRNDTSLSAGIGVRYAPSSRFAVSIAYSALHQTSNLIQAGFMRNLTTIEADYHL
jgi:hypothetical protein